ncbi:MAG: hypothetical protein C5B55_12610 [Blastocatellia bacterium]|nr:MAG: hypothetical protein C5B55_12610 [Blastocatellia bacterium]
MFSALSPLTNEKSIREGSTMAISIKDLKQLDEIFIRTDFSVYRFHVTDPTNCKGLLSGGVLGNLEHDARLEEVPTNDQRPQFSPKLEIGGCASFHVYVRNCLKRLTTSVIREVSLVRRTQTPTEC